MTSFELAPPEPVDSGVFRPIHYLGCKANITDKIRAALADLDPSNGPVCDLFSGSGVVSTTLAPFREVTAVDIQEYARVLASAMLTPPAVTTVELNQMMTSFGDRGSLARRREIFAPLIDYERDCIARAVDGQADFLVSLLEDLPLAAVRDAEPHTPLSKIKAQVLTALDKEGWSSAAGTTVSRYFGGLYFSFEQAVLLDEILDVAVEHGPGMQDFLRAATLSTASSLVNTVGKQFAQPLRPRVKSGAIKHNLIDRVCRDRQLDTLKIYESWLRRYAMLPRTRGKHTAIRADYGQAISERGAQWSVVYADPPYTRDHYSRFYHVLETMCLRDNPIVSRVVKHGNSLFSRGFYREQRHQSPFCIRSAAPNAFDTLLRGIRAHGLPLVLSYSPYEAGDGTHPRVVSMSQIMSLARSHFSRVTSMHVDGHTHNQFNRDGLQLRKREHAEVLLKCQP